MKEVSKKYALDIEGYSDVSVEITSDGSVKLLCWPNYTVSPDTFIKAMRKIADNIEFIKNNPVTDGA